MDRADPRRHRSWTGRLLWGLLIFVAGLLLGANIVYYLMRTRGADTAPTRPVAGATASPADTAPAAAAPPGRPAAPAAAVVAPPVPSPDGALVIPVAGMGPEQLVDTYTQSRGSGRLHDAIDIMAAAGTPVVAAVDGRVVKLFASEAGGITLYQFDPREEYVYYYAHLQGYAPGIAEGRRLRRGEVLGYVGATGNADPSAPHLHFAIARLGPEKRWHGGTPLNPYPLLTGRAPPPAPEAASAQR